MAWNRTTKRTYGLQISQDLVAFAIVPCGYPDALHSQQDRFDFKRVHYHSVRLQTGLL